ncbi:MAG: SMC domain protein [uncultured Aureispira sp.]|uniref:SMC domain protein n=1 Tax=uncultured Aureispira sp. TaxID=1331704 RepID=A0A6S6SQG7_9BACT|nr:MAG: SMC domain protein [uncultured Aureispira sp.]
MIYPQSFPNLFSSFSEEEVYGALSRLKEGRYATFYETELRIDEKIKSIPDFIVVDKEQGVLIVEVIGSHKDAIRTGKALDAAQQMLNKELEKLGLSSTIVVKSVVLEYHSIVYGNILDQWVDTYFVKNKGVISDDDFDKITNYLKINNKYYTPSGKLQGINLQNFKGIKKIILNHLPAESSWIFVTGENGFGKTCLLQGIALGLYGEDLNHLFNKPMGASSGSTLSYGEGPKVKLNVRTRAFGKKAINNYNYPKARDARNFRNICAYGASRLETYDDHNLKKEDNPILSLFTTKSLLRNIELNLILWSDSHLDVDLKKYHYTIQLLEKILNGMEISVSNTSKRVWYKEKREGMYFEPIIFDHLAAGYRSMIAMVGDILIRLFEAQPDIVEPAKLEGIVIIDELDLHWHPKWQKKLPGLLSELFPLVQFIASTHSPIPLLGAPEDSVFLKVNRTVEEGITVKRLKSMEERIKNLLPNYILTSAIFGMDDIKSVMNTDVKAINMEDSVDDELFYKMVDKKLETLFLDDKLEQDDSHK